MTVNLSEAKAHLGRYVAQAAPGELLRFANATDRLLSCILPEFHLNRASSRLGN
ncbi:MAG: hypothetical protein JWM99_1603 [Verrucomicrobiales bacterium]|nr:hypothetical protein [Verrucomicrobiales bacterium]